MKKTIINFCGIKIVMRVFLLLFFTILTSSSIAQITYGIINYRTVTIGYAATLPANAYEIDCESGECFIKNIPYYYNVEKVIIEKSFADYKATTCRKWFYYCSKLKSIVGVENINTTAVTDMSFMFNGCSSLTSLDLSKFNTATVTDMSHMFSGCSKLTSLDLCKFNTVAVTDMSYMFYECDNLTSLDLSGFNTSEVNNMSYMFGNCNHLRSVFVSDKWTVKLVTKFDNIFEDCWRLYGENETNNEGDDIKFARIDGGKENPGYFTQSGNTPYYPELFPYGIYDSNSKTLTIGYGKIPENAVEVNTKVDYDNWIGKEISSCYNYNVEKIIIEKSFADYKPTTCRNWFAHCSRLKNIEGVENINTQEVKDMSGMFLFCSSIVNLDLSNFITTEVTDMSRMFDCCYKLTSFDLSSFDTEKTIDMTLMFDSCSNITSLDLSNFKTDNVTNMTGMFNACNLLKAIFVSDKWSIKSVAKSNYIFDGCKVLYGEKGTHCESNDIKYACIDEGESKPGYFTRIGNEIYKPIVPYGIFDDTEGILTLSYGEFPNDAFFIDLNSSDYSYWIGSELSNDAGIVKKIVIDKSFANFRPTSCSNWFLGCYNLVEIEGLNNINTQLVTNMSNMFSGCSNLISLDLRGVNTSLITNMSNMFSGCSKMISLNLSDLNTAAVTDMSYMFSGCSKLTSLDLSGFNASKIKNMTGMFSSCYDLISLDLSGFNTAMVTSMSNMFGNCNHLRSVVVSDKWSTKSVKKSDYIFYNCWRLYGEKGTNNEGDNIKFARIDEGKDNPGYFTKSGNAQYYPELFPYGIYDSKTKTLTIGYGKIPENAVEINTKVDYDWIGNEISSCDNFNIEKIIFEKSFADYKPTTCRHWFYNCNNLVEIDGLENINTQEVIDMSGMFEFCYNLSRLDLSSFNTEKTTDMSCLFYRCYNIESLDLSNFNTTNVTNMSGMFMGCSKLTSLDISNFKTDNVVSMDTMFCDCGHLQTILVSSKWTTKSVINSNYIFSCCNELYGEKGTHYESGHIKYARIDEGEANPGYFTRKEKQVAEQIKMLTLPKIEYWEGENFSVDNGTFEVIFNYGDNQVVDLSEATISGFDSKIVGEQTITVSYLDLTTDFQITVNSKNPYTKPELKDNFYQISNALELLWFMYDVNNGDVNSNAVLVINIVINEDCLERIKQMLGLSKEATEIVEWQPIGTVENAYNGIFDGQGHTISGIYVNQTEKNDVGLFGAITSDAVIKNLGIVDSYISGKENVGAICGSNDGAIVNCYSLATTVSTDASSGIAGEVSENGIVENSYYLAENPNVGDSHAKTLEQFKNGEVAELLSKGTSIAGVDYSGDAFAGVVDLTGSDEQTNAEDPKTPVSEAIAKKDVKIWAFNKTIIVENASTEIYIVNSLGKQIVSKYPTSNHEEITISNSGVYIVKVGLITQKVFIE